MTIIVFDNQSVKICSVDFELTEDFICLEYDLFPDSEIDSSKLQYVETQNFNPSMTIMFIYYSLKSNSRYVYKLGIEEIQTDQIKFKFQQFLINSTFELKKDFHIQSVGFPALGNQTSVIVIFLYDDTYVYIIRISDKILYEPLQFNLTDKDVFVNDKNVMILDYSTLSMEFINLNFGYSITRTIWPFIQISPLITSKKEIYIIHDFLLVRKKDNSNFLLTLRIQDNNPFLSKGAIYKNVDPFQLKYICTDDLSLVVIKLNRDQTFQTIFSSELLKYQLSVAHSSNLNDNDVKENTLFSFFVVFHTVNKHSFFNQINIKITDDYLIEVPDNQKEIVVSSYNTSVNLTNSFSGNIYTIDFKASKSDTDDTQQE